MYTVWKYFSANLVCMKSADDMRSAERSGTKCSWEEIFEKFGRSYARIGRVRNEEVPRRAGIER